MKIAVSMSVGRLAPKHSLNIDGIRAISKNVPPSLNKNDVVLIDRLRSQDGKHLTIKEYTDRHFQAYIGQRLAVLQKETKTANAAALTIQDIEAINTDSLRGFDTYSFRRKLPPRR